MVSVLAILWIVFCPALRQPILYQYLSRFGDVTSHRHLIAPEWDQRLNFELAQFVYPYGHKFDMSVTSERTIAAILNDFAADAEE